MFQLSKTIFTSYTMIIEIKMLYIPANLFIITSIMYKWHLGAIIVKRFQGRKHWTGALMKVSPLYRFLKLAGGKINASLDSPTDTTCAKSNHLPCNYQLRHWKDIFNTVRNEWIFMINEINVLYQRSPFFLRISLYV